MTRKHFIQIANTIRINREYWSAIAIEDLMDFLQTTNPQFDKQRFLDYINTTKTK